MRIRRLEVSDCAGIANATVDFEPGLNVLHGPNELGKSSLVAAMRAALLLQPTSSAAEPLRDWHADAPAEVSLTFEQEAERIWRIRKRFGSPGGHAFLEFSRDGADFSQDSRGREVEAALQGILRWGIEAPGGQRRPRGLPSSLIATALLGRQDQVEAILAADLASDPSTTGRDHLTEALQALAEDPRFKQVLNDVQGKVDEAFTNTGRRRGGKGSPWTQLREQREQAEVRRRDLANQLAESQRAQAAAGDLRTKLIDAQQRAEAMREMVERRRARERAEQQVREAEAERRRIGAIFERLEANESAKKEAQAAVARADALQNEHAKRRDALAPKLAAAEAQVTELESGASEQGRRLREQEAENRLLTLRQALAQFDERIAALKEAAELAERIAARQASVAEKQNLLEQARTTTEDQRAQAEELDLEREVARFRAATRAAQRATEERDEALAQAVQATEFEAEAQARRIEAEDLQAPDAATINRLREAETALTIAREKLSVGIVMEVTLASGQIAEVVADRQARTIEGGRKEEFEAEQELRLDIPEVADIRVRGGGRDLLRQAEEAEARWQATSQAVFARAGSTSIGELVALREQADKLGTAAADADRGAAEARVRAEGLDALERRTVAADAALAQAHGGVSEFLEEGESVADLVAGLGDTDSEETIAEKLEELQEGIRNRRTLVERMQNELASDKREVEHLQSRLRERRAQLGDAADDDSWQERRSSAEADREQTARDIESVDRELSAIREEASQEVEAARQAAGELAAKHEAAQASLDAAAKELQAAQERLTRLDGETGPLRQSAENEDLNAATADLEAARRSADALPPSDDEESEVDLDTLERDALAAEREADLCRSELDKAEGALEQVGGQYLQEQAEQADEAVAALDGRGRDLEVDYGAWRMLREVLKEAEQEDAVHLGRALVKPVSERIGALTGGRYGEVGIGPQLDPSGIEVAGSERDFDALSVGTREQIALLLRLSIAEALGSFMVLDDQLTQSDSGRLGWMRDMLGQAAERIQIVVLTCHPDDYATSGPCNVVDLTQCIERSGPAAKSTPVVEPAEEAATRRPRRRRRREAEEQSELDLSTALKDSLR